jgi:hypothetical protein
MVTLNEMAEAHLTNVQKVIVDLQNQRLKIDEEIKRLSDYLQSGVDVLNKEKSKSE